MVRCHVNSGSTVLLLTPNTSATRTQTLCFFGIVSGITLLIALVWGLMGAWMVMPFAGLEVLVLILVLRKVLKESRQMQVITIDRESIKVEEGKSHPEHSWQFDRVNSYIDLHESNVPADAIQMSLVDSQKNIELGVFLNHQDLQSVREELQKAGIVICSNRWWVSS
ncbi:DUF2244 domain-containing protein [Ketobacter sp. MCCC 1A13808]|uniref:DUF2244 domain-containing protein n=1 Tax=Ketobacter sp. MCCC 1A13808 TaxID=2602738 RepID=UPI000F1D03B1|nr:DUF2244 domain-containing protein [Ketobacter sp. MCCC 1A13808]MVF13421.1 DUF2244 domain-containing protein [Ketobacter sp. MCCC 1A13808]RLP52940.1 MAG: DUF2244 domain-containing protein [Ketobacter sp.]